MSDLATLARDIRETLERADVADRRSDDLRITAGQMLLKAREEVQRQGLKWSPWVRENIPDRSARDIRRLLAIVQAPDPAEAAADARKKTREQVMESRLRNQGYRPDVARDIAKEDIRMSAPEGGMPVNQLEALLTAWDAASADIRAQFLSLRAAEIPCMKDHPAPALAAQPTPEPASRPQ